MKINYKRLAISILIPVVLGTIIGLITQPFNNYNNYIKPSFAPPGILFPIVWSILYTLMGISSYMINESNDFRKDNALFIYIIQLVVNLIWSIIFFVFKSYIIAFIWLLILIVFVVIMIKKFYEISKVSAYIQIPYLLWLIFAAILNFAIIILN